MVVKSVRHTVSRGLVLGVAALSALVTSIGPTTPAAASQHLPVASSFRQAECQYTPTQRMVQVNQPAIREASGLAASVQWPGVYWTLNDSGNTPELFAFREDGAALGAFRVTGASNGDWEALQLGPDGAGGHALYVGDVGDNDHQRRQLTIWRIPEPDPSSGGETAPATAFRFSYPGLNHNTEAMLVHPITGEILLITREASGMSLVFRLPLPLDSEQVMVADIVDVVNVRGFDPSSGQVTDAAFSADGKHIALRTYASILLFEVPDRGGIDAMWNEPPRVFHLSDGAKGEGLTFRPNSDDLLSIGEERPAVLYRTPWQC
ncbi:MAG: hypothetical protein IT306_19530 [Chloroflexi bacterium]|nr:hypothetical protein [Chloroflexota bacterium]